MHQLDAAAAPAAARSTARPSTAAAPAAGASNNCFSRLRCRLEALPVHDAGSAFVVFALCDPHLLEGAEACKDGASDPDGVLALWWGHHLDLHGTGSQRSDLLAHTVSNAWGRGAG